MKRHVIPAICAGAMLLAQSPTSADSLWQKRTRTRAFMFYDQPLYDIGDSVTILINQNTIVDNSEEKKMSKSAKASESFNFASQSSGGLGDQGAEASLDIDNDASRSFDGEAESTIDNRFTDRITVTVREVLPNGNLRVSGERKIKVDKNDRHLLISGIVRQKDISPEGTISFDYMASSNVQFVGLGEHQSFVRQGWMGRAMNRLWPF
jgi:flagellar L-ring protein FlgH